LSYAPDSGIDLRMPTLGKIHSRQLFDCSIAWIKGHSLLWPGTKLPRSERCRATGAAWTKPPPMHRETWCCRRGKRPRRRWRRWLPTPRRARR